MRTYYIFKINKYFAYFYKKYPYKMYKIIEELYNTKNYDINISYKYFKKFAQNMNKLAVNEYIYTLNKEDKNYIRDNNIHLIDNKKYNKIIVNSTCLILRTNDVYSIFLNEINMYMDNLFVCDFKNRDYFWLDNIKNDRQMNYSLV